MVDDNETEDDGTPASGDHEDAGLGQQDTASNEQDAETKSGGNKSNRNAYSWAFQKFMALVLWLDKHDGAVTAVATVVIAIFTIFLARYSADQGRITERQLTLMKRQIDSAERPWIDVSFVPTGDLSFGKDTGSIPIRVTLKNVGRTPAVALSVFSEGYIPDSPQDILSKQNEACGTFESDSARFGNILFPGDTMTFEQRPLFGKKDIETGQKLVEGGSIIGLHLFRNPTIGVCVSYKFPFETTDQPYEVGGDIHQTAIAWQLFKNTSPAGDRIIPVGKIPLSKMTLNYRSRLSVGNRAN